MNTVAKIEPQEQALATNALTPLDMLNRAVETGASIEVLEKLMGLQERWESSQARKAYDNAIAKAKAEIPPIAKNAEGHNKKRYADFAAIARVVDPILSKNGLSYRFRTRQDDKLISVTCVLSHRDGHSEEATLAGPADNSGNKNAIQAIGSTLTYLQRYSLVQALGLSAADDDDGAKSGQVVDTLSDEQIGTIVELLDSYGIPREQFLKVLQVESLADVYANRFDDVVRLIHQRGRK
jgi:hypothetical protein